MTGLFSKLLDTSGQSVSYMIEKITYICRNLKKRTPGSKGERETAEYLAAVLKEECGCDRVKLESFREHPDSFYGYFFLSTVCDVLCTLCYFISPWFSIFFGGTALFLFVVQFILYKELIDPLFPEKTGKATCLPGICTKGLDSNNPGWFQRDSD